jgi:tetratricopeptide (TPR) repeat protein
LKKNPQSLVFTRLADGYRKRGDIQQAIDVCSRGLANHPDSATGHIILGRCYLEQEKLKEALEEFISVIGHDRRNQVAIKMLADVYARQGMKDKAGDLYGYLFAMDADNGSLANLTETFAGTGKTNIYEILEFSPLVEGAGGENAGNGFLDESVSAQPADGASGASFAQTMQFGAEELSAGNETQDAAFTQTMKYDSGQLSPASSAEVELEAALQESATDGNTVTGDDISERMATMFEEEGQSAVEPSRTIDENIISDAEAFPPSPVPFAAPGADIVQTEAASPSVDIFEELKGSQPPITLSNEEQAASNVSGEDIVSRMTEMFDEPGAEAKNVVEVIGQGEKEIRDSEPVVFEEDGPKESDVVQGNQDNRIDVEESGDSLDGPAQLLDTAVTFEPEITAPDTVISGDDIAQRLETIFEEEPIALQNTIERLETAAGQEKPTETPEEGEIETIADERPADIDHDAVDEVLEMAEVAGEMIKENVGGDEIDMEVHENGVAGAGESVFVESDETSRTYEASSKLMLDEETPPEDAPEMSGSDVVTRLEELFPESLLTEDSLSKVEEIPEGEKDEETVNQGFYTISGNSAETAQSEDIVLEKLDDVEFEAPSASKTTDDPDSGEKPNASTADDRGLNRNEMLDAPPPFVAVNPEESLAAGNLGSALIDGGPFRESGGRDDQSLEYSIPDHVLTPTLADIYFQQGQPRLAVQIYERLLRKDPDNERIARRIEEIKKLIALMPEPPAEVKNAAKKPAPKTQLPRSGKSSTTPKPLAGVRIKKNLKKKPKNG